MTTDSSEVYRLLLEMQRSIHENHSETSEQVENVKQLFLDKLEPVENLVQKHENLLDMGVKAFTYIIPSGLLISIISWVSSLHK